MAIRITDEVYEGVNEDGPWSERERYVSGDYSSAAVYDDDVCVTVGRLDLELSHDRVKDLRDVLDAAVGLFG